MKFWTTKTEANREQGSSLVEVLLAIAIIVLTASLAFEQINNLNSTLVSASTMKDIPNWDLLTRYEIGKSLQNFQKAITEIKDETMQCRNPHALFTSTVVNPLPVTDISVRFGRCPFEPGFSEPGCSTKSYEMAKSYLSSKGSLNKKEQAFKEAMKRCSTQQTFRNADISARNSLYFCGIGSIDIDQALSENEKAKTPIPDGISGAIVEVKSTFWDFNTDNPMACNQMNGRPGRGIQAIYTVYVYSLREKDGQKVFSFENFSNQIAVAKRVY